MPTTTLPYPDLEREQNAFESQLDAMLDEHEGEFVLFKDGHPMEFFPAYDAAYRAGLDRFGLEGVFLVSEVKRRERQATSISWQSGVMS